MEHEAQYQKGVFLLGWIFLVIGTLAGVCPRAVANTSWQSRQGWSPETTTSRKYSNNSGSGARDVRPLISPFAPGSNNLSLDLGQVFLFGNLGNQYSDNIGSQLHYTYGVSELFAFDASLGYSEHSDGRFSMTTFLTGLRTNLSWYDKVVPFASFGLGFYRPSYRLVNDSQSNKPTNPDTIEPPNSLSPVLFGVHLGMGIDLEISSQIFFGAALTFHDVFGATKYNFDKKPIEVGGTFTTFFIHAGYTF